VSKGALPTTYRVILTNIFAVLLCTPLFLSPLLLLNVFLVFDEEQAQSVRASSHFRCVPELTNSLSDIVLQWLVARSH
jgi:hypothetical protein